MAQVVSLRNGRFAQTTKADLTEAFEGWDPEEQRLVLHFHGGLVSHKAGLRIADRLERLYVGAGAYPLFVLWHSSLWEVIVNDLRDIANEPIFKRLLLRVMQFVTGKVKGAKAGTRGATVGLSSLEDVNAALRAETGDEPYVGMASSPDPLSRAEEEQLTTALAADPVIRAEAEKIANWLSEQDSEGEREPRETESESTSMSPEVLEEIRSESTVAGDRGLITTARIVKGGVATVGRTLKRLHDGRDHGVFTTAVEELLRELYLASAGRIVWKQMKQDIVDAFGEDAESYGGTAILGQLAAGGGWDVPPVLVGHSAGAVYICNFLSHADATLPAHLQFDVVMLAPACDFRLMDETLAQHGGRIRRLRIFAMEDELEKSDCLLPLVYPRSLLYLVSGVMEREADWPLLGMERFHKPGPPYGESVFPEIARVRGAIQSMPDSVVWSVSSGGSGLESSATHHGDFDDDEATLASVRQFIATA